MALLIMAIFPLGLAGVGFWYLGYAVASLHSGALRTLPRTYIEKARFPVTYWVLFTFYICGGAAVVALAVGIWMSLIAPNMQLLTQ